MNKLTHILPFAIFLATISLPLKAQDTSKVPHSMLSTYLKSGSSKMIDDVEYTPLYIKFKKGVIFKPEKVQFRIQKKNGKETRVKCDSLSAIPEANLTKSDRVHIKENYTHRIWVRTDIKTDGVSKLVWNLPKGSVNISVRNEIKATIPLIPK